MENLLVWILIFAGATIGLLAIFLVASERELKAQREENPEVGAEPVVKDSFMAKPVISTAAVAVLSEKDETTGKIRDRVGEVNQLKEQLHSSQSTAEWLQERLNGLERHKSELADTNGVLQAELEAIKRRVPTSGESDDEARQARNQGELQNRQLAHEMAGLRSRHKNVEEFAAAPPDLPKQLPLTGKNETTLISIRDELADQRQMNSDLKDENLQLREQIFELERQVEIGVEECQRLVLAQQSPLGQNETLASAGPETQSTLMPLSELPSNQSGGAAPSQLTVKKLYDEPRAENRAEPIELTDRHESAAIEISPEQLYGAKEAALISSTSSQQRAGNQFAKVASLMVFVLLLGAIAAQAWRLDPGQDQAGRGIFSTQPALSARQTFGPSTPPARPEANLQGSQDQAGLETQTMSSPGSNDDPLLAHRGDEQSPDSTVPDKISLAPPQGAKETTQRDKAKATKKFVGSYETLFVAQVFREPNERTEPIAQIDAGVVVHVVSARNGWLEIRSQHGRPPGFIKYETAARTRGN